MFFSISNLEKYNALKKDIQGSIVSVLDTMFEKAHICDVRTEGNRTYVIFEWVDDGGNLQKETIFFDAKLFHIPE